MKITPENIVEASGKWHDVEPSSLLEAALPDAETPVIVGPCWTVKMPWNFRRECFLCRGGVTLDERDKPVMAETPTIVVMCETCYFKCQEVDA